MELFGDNMREEHFSEAKRLYEQKQFEQTIAYIDNHLWEGTPNLRDYVLKADAYFAMGQYEKGVHFPQVMINYKQPEQDDIEALKRLREYHRHDKWFLGYGKYDTRIKCILGEDIEKEILPTIDFFDTETILDAARYYYMRDDLVKAAFYHSIYTYFEKHNTDIKNGELQTVILQEENLSQVSEQLWSDNNDTVVFVIDTTDDYEAYFQMAKAVTHIGKKSIFIVPEIMLETGSDFPTADEMIALSYEYEEWMDDVRIMAPILFKNEENKTESNLLPLLNDISKHVKGNQLLMFAERRIFRKLKSSHIKRSVIHYIASNLAYDNASHNTNFGYINGYLAYLSTFFKSDAKALIHAKTSHKYSIVIPVRNNAATLRYTLQTCAEQEMDDYEILICDNSDRDDVYRLIKNEFADCNNIRYIRTPRILPLTKSFEFAFLNASGDFIIPIGADDALLPNALTDIENIRKRIGHEVDFFMWERLTYVWEGTKSIGQENMFLVPRKYKKGDYGIELRDTDAMLKLALVNPSMIYSLPLFYINSGFRKKYLLRMLKETGAILDGISQDIYTGVINMAINKKFYYVKYPLTIAALSGRSQGLQSTIGDTNEASLLERGQEYALMGAYAHAKRDSEDLLLMSDGDVANFCAMVLRAMDMGCLPLGWIYEFDWYVLGKRIIEQMKKNAISFDRVKKELIYTIALFSKEDAERIKNDMENQTICPAREILPDEKLYVEGETEEGLLILDAKQRGVHNVYDAATLYKNIER